MVTRSARFTADQLHRGLAAIASAAGLDPGGDLIKVTNNAVWRLASTPVVVRMALTPSLLHRTRTVILTARWLASHGVPAVRLVEDLPQPVVATDSDGTTWTATIWLAAEAAAGREPSGRDLGRLLRQVHSLPAPVDPLPPWEPLADIRRRLGDAESLPAVDRDLIHQLIDDLARELPTLRYALPAGPIHGDAHLGNLIGTAGGAVLCDFDSACLGPREIDLVPTPVGRIRFQRPAGISRDLVEAYGHDVETWSGWPTLRRLRELKLVTSVLPILASQPTIASRWRQRMSSLRDVDAIWPAY